MKTRGLGDKRDGAAPLSPPRSDQRKPLTSRQWPFFKHGNSTIVLHLFGGLITQQLIGGWGGGSNVNSRHSAAPLRTTEKWLKR